MKLQFAAMKIARGLERVKHYSSDTASAKQMRESRGSSAGFH
jgi:hypothetical protein